MDSWGQDVGTSFALGGVGHVEAPAICRETEVTEPGLRSGGDARRCHTAPTVELGAASGAHQDATGPPLS